MDALIYTLPVQTLSQTHLIKRERRPLPSHQIEGSNFRKWAVAVCQAEVDHREQDYARVERLLGLNTDRYDFPNDVSRGQFPHEAHAGAALHWLSQLQTHESTRRAAWDCLPWRLWSAERRAKWIAKRRYLWSGFLAEVRAYQQTKGEG